MSTQAGCRIKKIYNSVSSRWSVRHWAIRVVLSACFAAPLPPLLANEIPSSIDYTMYKLATEKNDTAAQYFIGRKFYLGTKVAQNKAEAAKWFKLAAAKGHTKARYLLGKMYLEGDGVPKKLTKAKALLTMAAEKNHTDAQYELGNFFFFGYDGHKDVKEAVKWYTAAAEDRHARAQLQLGKILYGGIGIDADKTRGKKWLQTAYTNGLNEAKQILDTDSDEAADPKLTMAIKPAPKDPENPRHKQPKQDPQLVIDLNQAKAGNVDAQYTVGVRYLKGDAVNKNPRTAVKWLRKAAEQNHAGAQFQLGVLYRDGIGVPRSESEAIKWLRLASSWGIAKAQRDLDAILRKQLLASEYEFTANPELSSPDAQFALGLMYANGKGVARDPNTAAQWFLKAARQNHREAQYRIGEMYKEGIGVKTNLKQAKTWLSKAANSGIVKASRALADILKAEEQKILDDELKALKNAPIYPYLFSARQGNLEAQYKVGLMYIEGKKAPKDVTEGIRWLQNAAHHNHTLAQLTLGKIYLEGNYHMEKDYYMAMKWLEKAAAKGEPEAQYFLGNMYRKGLGVNKSSAEAVKWFRLAAKQGHKKARKQLGGCRIC